MNRLFTRVYHRLDVLSPCRLPAMGPAILICNHTSGLDPQLIQSCCPRMITWMMAQEYYDLPVIKHILDAIGVIRVTRSGRDTSATRAAMRALHDGQLLGIFPEGKIETSRELLPFQTGVAMMAIKTGVRVYPAYLDGTQRGCEMVAGFLRPHHATVAFGDEVAFARDADDRDGLTAATTAMQAAIASLRNFSSKTRRNRGL